MQDFHFTMTVNKSTPKLFLACVNGQHIPKAVLTWRRAGKEQQEFLSYTFTDHSVSSHQTGGSRGGDVLPVDRISLNYSRVDVEYKDQKADGTLAGGIKAGWDVKANKKV